IRFNGDVMETTLNIGATYKTKASLSTLIADTSSVNNRRPVECGLAVSGQLKNPRLNFSINIPDLDPVVKSRVESALSTEDKVQKQFLSLLISNGFLPDEQSGIVNNSSVLMSNVTEIMANQVNNIFQKLNIPLDLGLSYQQNSRGRNIFDVAVSTQLFNNRVVVNGNIGNRQYRTSNSNSDVVGDIDIEIKLDRQGVFRLNLFSHSADQYSNYLDNSQRNGVGITFQQEFNRFGQLVRRTFAGRKKREKMEMDAIEAARNEEKVSLKITPDDKKKKRREN
ncbi:MAG: translocation/assembly module TamB domain-containing protein, partial [Candidatus Cryptobacteroides sp.]